MKNQSNAPNLRALVPIPADPGALLDAHQCGAMLGCKYSKIYAMVRKGQLPKPLKLFGKLSRWRREWVENLISSLPQNVDPIRGGRKTAPSVVTP